MWCVANTSLNNVISLDGKINIIMQWIVLLKVNQVKLSCLLLAHCFYWTSMDFKWLLFLSIDYLLVSMSTSNSLASRYLFSLGPRDKNNEHLSAFVRWPTFRRIL